MVEDTVEDLVSLALAAYRTPICYQKWWDTKAELPQSMHVLLWVAEGENSILENYCREKRISKEKLQEAVVFFIKQVFFVQDASYYRVLGLDPEASQEQIKENYRLLMRLFHPDRQNTQETWTEAYAWRVNQAYHVLRKPALRKHYDDKRQPLLLERAAINDTPTIRSIPAGRKTSFINASSAKRLPYLVLGSVAILAVLFLINAYHSDQYPTIAVGIDDNAETQESAQQATKRNKPNGLAFDSKTTNPLVPHHLTVGSDVPEKSSPSLRVVADTPNSVSTVKPKSAERYSVPVQSKENVTRPVEKDRIQNKQESKQAKLINFLHTKDSSNDLRENLKAHKPVQADHPQVPLQPVVSERELRILLGRLISAYERGDLKSFMRLFSRQARVSGKKGKADIQQEYQKLFYTTQSRRMHLKNIIWHPVGDIMRGDGRFSIEVRTQNEQHAEQYSGRVVFEVEQENGRLLIRGFYHQSDS